MLRFHDPIAESEWLITGPVVGLVSRGLSDLALVLLVLALRSLPWRACTGFAARGYGTGMEGAAAVWPLAACMVSRPC
jgi:hypothetical protein